MRVTNEVLGTLFITDGSFIIRTLTTPIFSQNRNSLKIKQISQPFRLTYFLCSGGRTRTCDLRVMSPTSYRLLYPAVLDCKSMDFF